ncbi:MAG TPA: Mur ligase family protein [Acidimicrobiia bacterium]
MIWVLALACVVAAVPAGLRWLRVAQREHYLPSVTRFAFRWWANGPINLVLITLAVVGVIGAWFYVGLGLLVVFSQVGPVGLSVKGRTSPLSWTARLRRVAIVSGVIFLIVIAGGVVVYSAAVVVGALLLLPLIIDLALLILAPIEARMGNKWVEKAGQRLRESGARVVAITGSYGKTTTKEYLHHLIGDEVRSVASPASFNNRMGLARAINERLVPGTDVFIAEMGTYGRGEISELCAWLNPEVSAIVSIGPVHLERFRTEENIVAAKAEILDGARLGVLAIDHPLLAVLAEQRSREMEIVTVGSSPADIVVDLTTRRLSRGISALGVIPDDVFATNLAVAVGIAGGLGIEVDPARFATLPRAEHRQSESLGSGGFLIIDDTFNSNPAGAERALNRLVEVAAQNKRVLVTPGMVELGPLQDEANSEFARRAAAVCDHIFIVGRTNRSSLLRGSDRGSASVTVVAEREDAVDWVRENLTAGDAVLYENDLPDHYP